MRTLRFDLMIRFRTWWPALVLLLALGTPAFGQESRGSIVGRISDTTGAVVAGAAVKATDRSTNLTVTVQSNQQGNYQLLFLHPGLYDLSAAVPGFRQFQRNAIEVRTGDRVGVDIELQVGDVAESVIVAAETPLLETASANVGQVLDNRRISELPIPHGTTRTLFMFLPGVNTSFDSTLKYADPSRPATSSLLSINGAPFGSTEFTLDGVPNTQSLNSDRGSAMANQPPVDAIQEVKLETAYDASVGHTSGAHINMVIKSGSNAPHGSGYFFYRNPTLNANSFMSNRARLPRPDFDYKRLGFSATGPVYIPRVYNGKDRTFFSYAYERMNEKNLGYTFVGTVPTAAARNGDFSSLLALGQQYQIYDPATITPAAGGRTSRLPLAGNIVPASRISPIAKAMATYWPQPNMPGTVDGLQNYAADTPSPLVYDNHIVRLDHSLTDKHRMYGRYSRYAFTGGPNRDNYHNIASGTWTKINAQNIVLDDIYTPTSNLVINMRFGYQRAARNTWLSSTGFDLASLGFSKSVVDLFADRPPAAVTFPGVTVSGLTQLLTDTSSNVTGDDIYSWFFDVNRVFSNHAVKVGADFRVYRKNWYRPNNGTPSFTFNTAYTQGPLDNSPASPAGVGQGMAAFLLGQPSGGSVTYNDSAANQSTYYALYIQDDWRVTPKLTLTGGLRWEYDGALTERFDRSVRGFDPSATLAVSSQAAANYAARPIPEVPASAFQVRGGLLFAGAGGQPRELYRACAMNLNPRVGLAYTVLKNTVIRAGYGIYFVPTGVPAQTDPIQPGYSQVTTLVPTVDNGVTFVANLSNPYPAGLIAPRGNRDGVDTYVGRGISFFEVDRKASYNQRWNANVQQLLPARFLVEVGYAGSRVTKLPISRNLNALPNQYLSTLPVRDQAVINRLSSQHPNPFYPLLAGTNLAGVNVAVSQLLLPYPQFPSIGFSTYQGYSWYHSMQSRIERRFSHGFTYQFSYTFSKTMEALVPINAADPLPYRSISGADRPHHIGMSAIYELPFGKGRPFLAGLRGPAGAIINGWQIGMTYQYWSGPPLEFGDVIFNGDLKAIPLPGGVRTIDRWFNVDAGFERTPAKQLGSHYRTFPLRFGGIRGDGVRDWDFSLLKYTNITEQVRLQFRAEAFNAFNQTSFTAPNTSVTSSAFGTVTGENNLARVVQFALKVTF